MSGQVLFRHLDNILTFCRHRITNDSIATLPASAGTAVTGIERTSRRPSISSAAVWSSIPSMPEPGHSQKTLENSIVKVNTSMEMTFAQFRETLRIQIRVIKALVKREFIALYGRQGLGFLMMFVEPLVIMGFVIAIISYRRIVQDATFPVIAFVLSGWGIMWMCRYPASRMAGVLQANISFLYHRQISISDIFISRAILAVLSALVSFIILLALFIAIINDRGLNDPLAIIVSIFFTVWHALILSFISAILSTYSFLHARASILLAISQVFLTGAFFMVDWIPIQYRYYVLLLPMVHVTELMRYGMFGNVVQCFFNIYYIVFSNIILTFFSLQLLWVLEKRNDAYNSAE